MCFVFILAMILLINKLPFWFKCTPTEDNLINRHSMVPLVLITTDRDSRHAKKNQKYAVKDYNLRNLDFLEDLAIHVKE